MSEEFIKIATQEINDELSSIDVILQSCTNDHEMKIKSSQIEEHVHKIKGLSPMMGKKEIGEISASIDRLLKATIEGTSLPGLFEILKESTKFMKNSMTGNNANFEELQQKIKTNYSKFLN